MPTVSAYRQQVAANVRAEMARAGIRQKEILDLLDMDRTTLSKRLNGHLPFSADELHLIAEHLGIEAALLLGATSQNGSRRCSPGSGFNPRSFPPVPPGFTRIVRVLETGNTAASKWKKMVGPRRDRGVAA